MSKIGLYKIEIDLKGLYTLIVMFIIVWGDSCHSLTFVVAFFSKNLIHFELSVKSIFQHGRSDCSKTFFSLYASTVTLWIPKFGQQNIFWLLTVVVRCKVGR